MRLLFCLARAVARNGFRILADAVPFGSALYEVAVVAWHDFRGDAGSSEAGLVAELRALAEAPVSEVRQQAAAAALEYAVDQPPELQLALTSYLSEVPAMVRRTLRGTTATGPLVVRGPDDLAALLPPRAPRFRPGDRPLPGVGWELEELLGVGGFGEVWKARHPEFAGIVAALKFCLDERAAKSLRHEAANLDRVLRHGRHPGIVPLRQVYLDANPVCLEYEYIDGGDLSSVVRAGPLAPPDAARLVLQLASAVSFAHGMTPPLVHRDLKPANVLLSVSRGSENRADEATPLVADFGISEVAAAHAIGESSATATAVRGACTPLYASPQQMRGDPADPRDDVHALGVIWHQLLTGDLTRGRPSGRGWRGPLAERGVSDAMLDLLQACVDDEPTERPANAGDLARRIEALLQAPVDTAASVASPRRRYELRQLLARGDVANVHLAHADGVDYVLKVSRISDGADLLEGERRSIACVLTMAGDSHYRHYFPTLAESFPTPDDADGRVNVYTYRPGFYTLEEVRRRYPTGVDPRHLAWIFKRLLTALGFVHRCGLVHGAVLPPHVMIHAESHGLQLVGWPHTVETGRPLRTILSRYRDWYPPEVLQKKPASPAADVFLAAQCLVYLAGGDPPDGSMPESVPDELGRFVRACLLEGPQMRPGDAWRLFDEFEELLRGLYGPPKFHHLDMNQEG